MTTTTRKNEYARVKNTNGGPYPFQHERKQRVLNYGAAALVCSISGAVVVKNQDLFFLTEPDGSVPLGYHYGLGLYFHDCRFLNGFELRIGKLKPEAAIAVSVLGTEGELEVVVEPITARPAKAHSQKRKESIG